MGIQNTYKNSKKKMTHYQRNPRLLKILEDADIKNKLRQPKGRSCTLHSCKVQLKRKDDEIANLKRQLEIERNKSEKSSIRKIKLRKKKIEIKNLKKSLHDKEIELKEQAEKLSESHHHREILEKEIHQHESSMRIMRASLTESDSTARKLRNEIDLSKIENYSQKAAAAAAKITNLTQELLTARWEKDSIQSENQNLKSKSKDDEKTITRLKQQIYDSLSASSFRKVDNCTNIIGYIPMTKIDLDSPVARESSSSKQESAYESSDETNTPRLTIKPWQRNARVNRIEDALEFYTGIKVGNFKKRLAIKYENKIYLEAENNQNYFDRIAAAVRRIRAKDIQFVSAEFLGSDS